MAPVLGSGLLTLDELVGEVHDVLGRLRGRAEFGAKGKVGLRARIHSPEQFEMGDGTTISNYTHRRRRPRGRDENCTFNQYGYISGAVEIGDGVRIANKASIHATSHVYEDPDEMIHEQGSIQGTITIEDDIWIGSGVRILRDVTIGEGAVVGAGAVVTDDVESYTVVGGVPAEQIATRE